MTNMIDQDACLRIDFAQALYTRTIRTNAIGQFPNLVLIIYMEIMMRLIVGIPVLTLQIFLIRKMLINIIR